MPPPPLPSRANNAAQINKVKFQFRHRRPKLTLRGMGDAWHLCWMRRYAPRYRWPLKTRDFVWEIKYWDSRTLNNVKSNLRCIAPCFGVCLSLYCFFGLYCITTVKAGDFENRVNCIPLSWTVFLDYGNNHKDRSKRRIHLCLALLQSSQLCLSPRGGYFRNFWVGMCRWDPGTLNL